MSTHTTPDHPDDPAVAESQTLEKDVVFELLKNQRRRRVVEVLDERGAVSLGDLAETIAAEENDTTVAALSADERKRVYIGLYQTHLPKMDEAGVVDYDQDAGTVSPGPAMPQLVPYLDPGVETDPGVAARQRLDLSAFDDPVTLPAWAFLAALVVVGLVTVAATAVPGPAWIAVLVLVAAAATWTVRWQ